jgi:CPA2 family monovalent cation:H+ antiporter-2
VLCVAAIVTVVFQAIRQPLVVGYLVAGMIVGPHVPVPLLADQIRIQTLSELGVILLMFALGLEFSVRRLVRMGPVSGFITAVNVGTMLWLGYVCGALMGWTRLESVFTGALLSISSTTIVAKVFEERRMPERLRELVFGVLLTEDMVAVIELAILTALAAGSEVSPQMIGITVGRLALFLALLVGIGLLVVPRLFRLIARLGSDETLLVASIGACFAFAIVAENAGYSVALGAFLAGSLVAESHEGHRIEKLIRPVRDMFGAVFFISVGMMLDPRLVGEHWAALVVLVVAVMVGKIVGVGLGALLAGNGPRLSIESGMSLAQIGEFSFIIARLAIETHAAREFLYSLAVAVSVITTFLTPFMIRAAGPVADAVERRLPRALAMFEAIYDSWVELMRSRAGSRAEQASIRRSLAAIASGATLIAAVVIATDEFILPAAMWISQQAAVSFEAGEAAAGVAGLLLAMLPAYALYRASRSLAVALADRAIARGEGGEPPEGWEALVELIQAAALFPAALIALAVVQPFLDPIDGIAVIALAAGALGWVTWRSARAMRGQLRNATRLIVEALVPGARAQSLPTAEQEHMIPGLGLIAAVRLQEGSPLVGMTVGELDLRALTGAVVVAIGRDGGAVVAPADDERLRSGDVLGLAGPSDAVRKAGELLESGGSRPARTDSAPI